jgi:uncharacterized membrane protein
MRREGELPGAKAASASIAPATTGPARRAPQAAGEPAPSVTDPAHGVTDLISAAGEPLPAADETLAAAGEPLAAAGEPLPAAMEPRRVLGGPRELVREPPLVTGDGHETAAPTREPGIGAAEPGPAKQAGPADRIPWLIALAVFAAYVPISVFRYLRLEPTSWDLGIFTEYVKQYADLHAPVVDVRGAGVNLLGDHFHPIVALIAPFFRLFPSPVTLLVAQALLAAVSVVPVSRAAAARLGTGAGRAIGAAYGFSWGLQQLVNFDFHEIAFAVPLLAFSLSALVRGRMRAAVWWAMPLVFVKEDQGFTLAGIGIIMAIVYKEQIAGLFLAAWGLAWSFLAVSVIIPHLNQAHRYLYWSDGGAISPVGGHVSLGGLISQLIAGSPTKLPTLAMILLPTVFIALRSPLVLAAVPSLLLRFVGTNIYYWGTDWHYNATVMPIVFIAAIDAVARIRAARTAREGWAAGQGRAGRPGPYLREPRRLGAAVEQHGAAMMLAIAAALAFQFPLSNLWNPQTYTIGPHVAAARAAMALVPDGAQVATDLDLLAPLAARTDTYWLGNSATNPATTYVVFDTASTDWQPPPRNVLTFVESLSHGVAYQQVYLSDGVYVFIRAAQASAG